MKKTMQKVIKYKLQWCKNIKLKVVSKCEKLFLFFNLMRNC